MKVNSNKVKKVVLLMALLAPMIYLFGSLFEALKGSNGQQVFAEPVYVQEYVEVDSYVEGYSYKMDIENVRALLTETPFVNLQYSFNFSDGTTNYGRIIFNTSGDGARRRFGFDDNYVATYTIATDTYNNIGLPASIYFDSIPSNLLIRLQRADIVLYRLESVPSSTIIESPSAYSDYVFKNFFVKNNFLAVSGEKVINGTPDYGFAPAADMIRFVDGNMFHLANVEYGALIIGYTYYAFHVVCVFLIFNLLMFFPHLIENVYEKFERGW